MPAQVVDVAAAVIVRDGRLLLARRTEPPALAGAWELPGGTALPGETREECLARELQEELGIKAIVGPPLGTSRLCTPRRVVAVHAFLVLSYVGEPKARVHDRLAWAAPADWVTYRLAEADVGLLRDLAPKWDAIAGGGDHGD